MIALTSTNEVWRFIACRALSPVWPGAAFSKLAPVKLRALELNSPADWCRIRITQCGLCASDLHLIHAQLSPAVAPSTVLGNPRARAILGHELVGIVEHCPDGRFPIGQRVVSRSGGFRNCHNLGQPPCPCCAAGEYALCIHQGAPSPAHEPWRGGGFASHYAEPSINLLPAPPQLNDDETLLAEPLACALRAVLRIRPTAPRRALVIGAGLQGLGAIHWLKALVPDCRIHCQARHAFQADLARTLGASEVLTGSLNPADWSTVLDAPLAHAIRGNQILLDGFDAVIDTIAAPRTFEFALRVARPGGHVVILGAHLARGRIDYSPIWFREVTVSGVYAHGPEQYDGRSTNTLQLALDLLSTTARLPVSLLTHRIPLSDYRRAADLMANKSTSKAIRIALIP